MLIAFALMVQPSALACDTREPTPEASLGPHDFSALPAESNLWREGDDGEPLFLHLRVLDTCGEPVVGARVKMLHANYYGEHEADRWRAELTTNASGELKVTTVYPGYAGSIARHIHFIIDHPEHRQLVTRLFFKNDPAVDESVDALALVLDEIRRDGVTGWVGGYEFVLAPR